MTSTLPDLNFHNSNTLYATHSLHAFAAKFPPQLAEWAIKRFTEPGQTVCDPMMGSGTTLVEAYIRGRLAIGLDIDRLACLIASAKATPVDRRVLHEANSKLLTKINELRIEYSAACSSGVLPADLPATQYLPRLPRLNYWFMPQVQVALVLLKQAITATPATPAIHNLWHAAFSSLIVAKTSVANARDIVHSRHHYQERSTPPDVFDRFRRRLHQIERQMKNFLAACALHPPAPGLPEIRQEDARELSLADESVDLVLTSPPYCNALDYTRANRFAIAWLADMLGTDLDAYMKRGRDYVGSERASKQTVAPSLGIHTVDVVTQEVLAIDEVRGRLVARYFADMQAIIRQIARVLRKGGHAVLVVCPSNIRRIQIDWHTAFSAIAAQLEPGQRLCEIEVIERTIDDRRRLLPYMNAGDQLAQRMRTEYVLVLQKETK